MSNIFFTIITPTYNRPKKIIRTINSVLEQTYKNWEMVIVKDNPNLDYDEVKKYIKNHTNIKFIENKKNIGNNGSKNVALKNISKNTDYITFLDDDDWFDKNTLKKANEIISKNKHFDWFVSNRSLKKGQKITKNNKKTNEINYVIDVLIFKKFTGDATHFVNYKKYKDIKFSETVKLTEEWFYFSNLSGTFYYYDFNSTYQEQHQDTNITSFYNKNKKERLKNTYKLYKELFLLKNFNPMLWFIYLPLRILAIILK